MTLKQRNPSLPGWIGRAYLVASPGDGDSTAFWTTGPTARFMNNNTTIGFPDVLLPVIMCVFTSMYLVVVTEGGTRPDDADAADQPQPAFELEFEYIIAHPRPAWIHRQNVTVPEYDLLWMEGVAYKQHVCFRQRQPVFCGPHRVSNSLYAWQRLCQEDSDAAAEAHGKLLHNRQRVCSLADDCNAAGNAVVLKWENQGEDLIWGITARILSPTGIAVPFVDLLRSIELKLQFKNGRQWSCGPTSSSIAATDTITLSTDALPGHGLLCAGTEMFVVLRFGSIPPHFAAVELQWTAAQLTDQQRHILKQQPATLLQASDWQLTAAGTLQSPRIQLEYELLLRAFAAPVLDAHRRRRQIPALLKTVPNVPCLRSFACHPCFERRVLPLVFQFVA